MKTNRIHYHLWIILILLAIPAMITAQPGRMGMERKERIEAQKIAFITERLQLTPAEAQAFWPLYNEHNAKREEIIKEMRARNREHFKGNMDAVSEEEALKCADAQIIEEQMLLDLKKEYHAKYKSVLPASKILKLYHVEREFKRVLLERMRGPKRP